MTKRSTPNVFAPEYWGEVQPASHHKPPFIPFGERTPAVSLLPDAWKRVANGETGVAIPDGTVYDPSDPSIAELTPHHFPGTILIADIESKSPVAEGSGTNVMESRDAAIIPVKRVIGATKIEKGRGTSILSAVAMIKDGERYDRLIDLIFIAKTRRGVPAALGCFSMMKTATKRGDVLMPVISTDRPARGLSRVGETFAMKKGIGAREGTIRRLRSLAVLEHGHRVPVRRSITARVPGLNTTTTD
jgi:hypothetical protein